MAEIIAKSKAAKRERAKEKEEDDDQLAELDNVFKSLADVRIPQVFPSSFAHPLFLERRSTR